MKSYMLAMVYLLTALSLTAQEIILTVDAPQSAAAGERFRISLYRKLHRRPFSAACL